MNDTAVQETNTDCKPKLHKNDQLVFQIALDKIRFCISFYPFNTSLLKKSITFLKNTKMTDP